MRVSTSKPEAMILSCKRRNLGIDRVASPSEWVEWVNECMRHLYSALCIAVHNHEGNSPQPPPVCRIHLSDATAAPVQHTSYRWRGESLMEPIQMDGDYKKAIIDKGQWREFGQDNRVTPLLFLRSVKGLLVTTESQGLGLIPHPKGWWLSVKWWERGSTPLNLRPWLSL